MSKNIYLKLQIFTSNWYCLKEVQQNDSVSHFQGLHKLSHTQLILSFNHICDMLDCSLPVTIWCYCQNLVDGNLLVTLCSKKEI